MDKCVLVCACVAGGLVEGADDLSNAMSQHPIPAPAASH